MRKVRTTIADERYLIFYAFEDIDDDDTRQQTATCESITQLAAPPDEIQNDQEGRD